MQKKKKMLLVKMGSLLGKVCVEKGRLPLWPEKLLKQLTHFEYTNNDKHTF